MAMTRMIPCKAKAVPSLVEGTRSLSFSNKQPAADSSSVLVVAVGLEASRFIFQVVAIEPISATLRFCHHCIWYSLIIAYCMFGEVHPISPCNEA
jgi:hypothetical protein